MTKYWLEGNDKWTKELREASQRHASYMKWQKANILFLDQMNKLAKDLLKVSSLG